MPHVCSQRESPSATTAAEQTRRAPGGVAQGGAGYGQPGTRQRRLRAGLIAIAILIATHRGPCVARGHRRHAFGARRRQRTDDRRENELPGTRTGRSPTRRCTARSRRTAAQASVNRGETLDLYVSTKDDGTRYDARRSTAWAGTAAPARASCQSIKNIDGDNQGRWDPRARPPGVAGPARSIRRRCSRVRTGSAACRSKCRRRLGERLLPGALPRAGARTQRRTRSSSCATTRRHAPALVQASTNTWQAYNIWGDASLYGSFGADRKYVREDAARVPGVLRPAVRPDAARRKAATARASSSAGSTTSCGGRSRAASR